MCGCIESPYCDVSHCNLLIIIDSIMSLIVALSRVRHVIDTFLNQQPVFRDLLHLLLTINKVPKTGITSKGTILGAFLSTWGLNKANLALKIMLKVLKSERKSNVSQC